MSCRVCLVTSEQVSTNPRLVKEADALVEAGYEVRVVACQWESWATKADRELLAQRRWRYQGLNWSRDRRPALFWYSRFRHRAAGRLLSLTHHGGVAERAAGRIVPELIRAAASEPADLFIGHNLPSLPVVVSAARTWNARVGFDAEDCHSRMQLRRKGLPARDPLACYLEEKYLHRCDYLTAASPQIAEAYAADYRLPLPVTLLNVFPLSQRPQGFRNREGGIQPLRLYWFSQTIGADRGVEDVVKAMGLLRGIPVELHLRGNWQPGYRRSLHRLADSVGVAFHRILAHEPSPPDEMVRLAAPYDVGLALEHPVSVNREICLTNKIFTYLLAGNAVVATATPAQRALMDSLGEAGVCYEPGDAACLARRLQAWWENPAQLHHARAASWRWGSLRFNWDTEKKKFLHVVEQALRSRRRREEAALSA